MLIKILKTIRLVGGIDFELIVLLFIVYGCARTVYFENDNSVDDLPNGWEDAFDFVFTILLDIFVICFGLAMSTAISLLFNGTMKAIWQS